MKASIGQLKYRHIFKLMFSCCILYDTELDAKFVLCCCKKVRILWRQNSQTLWSLAKRLLKQGGQIVCLIFLYGNSGDSNRIFSDVLFAYNEKEIQHPWSLYHLSFNNRIRFIPSLLYGLKDVIASENSVFEVRNLDFAVICENTHLKYFVFGDMTGPAKVSHVHCRPSLPVLVS